MDELERERAGNRPPFPLTTPAEWIPTPRRPRIVWAYLIVSVVALGRGVVWMAAREGLAVFTVTLTVSFTAIAMLLIWNASRIGWSFLAAWSVFSIPFILTDEGTSLYVSMAIEAVMIGILFSPWMVRWIWRDGRKIEDRRER